jgi:hypothetical protein
MAWPLRAASNLLALGRGFDKDAGRRAPAEAAHHDLDGSHREAAHAAPLHSIASSPVMFPRLLEARRCAAAVIASRNINDSVTNIHAPSVMSVNVLRSFNAG